MQHLPIPIHFAVAVLLGAPTVAAQDEPLLVPARAAFAHPDPRGMRRSDDSAVTRWRDTLVWYGRFTHVGELEVMLRLKGGLRGEPVDFVLECGSTTDVDSVTRVEGRCEPGATQVVFPTIELTRVGYHRLALRSEGGVHPGLLALELSGPAREGAHFSTVERRNAASVHLGWQVPDSARDEVEWFYCEVTPRDDPLWTYYMATGWRRGYFGMQVNSATERRLIFSVWDAGDEAVDRSKVAAEDRVELVAKGDGVVASGFGNEGTGGHSHLVFPWQLGDTFRFAVHAVTDGEHTTYSGWFWFAERGEWGLIASFRTPRDGRFLHGLYSFNENFAGDNGDLRRVCEFGNAWVRTTSGEWHPLRSARFTHDGHGARERLDRSAGITGSRFYLAHGGFVDDTNPAAVTQSGARLELPRERLIADPPKDLLTPRRK